MYKLTERRFQKVAPILEEYLDALASKGCFATGQVEPAMRKSLGLGYNEFKDIMLDVVRRFDRYRLIALYYMQNENSAVGTVQEFQSTLSGAYHAGDCKTKAERDRVCKAFWDKAITQLREEASGVR